MVYTQYYTSSDVRKKIKTINNKIEQHLGNKTLISTESLALLERAVYIFNTFVHDNPINQTQGKMLLEERFALLMPTCEKYLRFLYDRIKLLSSANNNNLIENLEAIQTAIQELTEIEEELYELTEIKEEIPTSYFTQPQGGINLKLIDPLSKNLASKGGC